MKKIIFYYSVTGGCQTLAQYIKDNCSEVECVDIRTYRNINLDDFDLIGFLTPVYYLDIPPVLKEFINSLPNVKSLGAFIIVGYSVMVGRSIKNISRLLINKGFKIRDYRSILLPETYPPFRKKGIKNDNYPLEFDLEGINGFISNLCNSVEKKVKLGFWNFIISPPSISKIKKDMGKLALSEDKCTKCKKCMNSCDYEAISFNNGIIFKMDKCSGCFGCFNTCENKAISTSNIKSDFAC